MFASCKHIAEVLTYLQGNKVEYYNICSKKYNTGIIMYRVTTPDPWTGEEISTSDSIRYDIITGELLS